MKISIVIPVYNGEMFLRETLSSVEGQSFRDFECLCINDGGRDGSAAIINELAKRDDRFVFIDKSKKVLQRRGIWGLNMLAANLSPLSIRTISYPQII